MVLDKDVVYRKTDRAAEALAVRHGGLTPRQRSLLVLVDGRRSAQELGTLGAACGDVEELLRAMQAQGLVERAAARAGATQEVRPAAPTVPLAQVRKVAVRRLNDLLGPSATDLCLRLEAAHSAEEFRAAVRRVEATLRQAVGPQRAAQFVSEVDRLAI